MNFCFFTVSCPDSRSEALRLEADLEAGVELEVLSFFNVACSFFQLLERAFVSIPSAAIQDSKHPVEKLKAKQTRSLFFVGRKVAGLIGVHRLI